MIITNVQQYIKQHQLLHKGAKVVVGFSGGADSVALLHMLLALGYDCVAAHCNFQLRGEASDADARFAKQWCADRNITFRQITFDTEAYAQEQKISIEMAARNLRYNWFHQLREELQADAIAVAHHRDDSVETVLLNLSRGTGISGLRGIQPRNGRVVRPLLSISRQQVEQYLDDLKMEYRTDHTNLEAIYRRNHLRLIVLPELQKVNPSVHEAIARTADILAETEKVYRHAIDQGIARVVKDSRADIAQLQQEVSPAALLYEWLTPLGFSAGTIDDITQALDAESGRQFLSDTHRIIKDREQLILERIEVQDDNTYSIEQSDSRIENPIRLEIEELKQVDQFERSGNILYADADKLQFPLTLRRWQHGDWFIPFGMTGRKKVSDYFSDNKFSLADKEQTWLLFSGTELVWIVGHRSDNRFRVNRSTGRILKIKYTPNK